MTWHQVRAAAVVAALVPLMVVGLLWTMQGGERTTGHCTALHCTALHCIALHCTALHCTALHCTALHCTALTNFVMLETMQ